MHRPTALRNRRFSSMDGIVHCGSGLIDARGLAQVDAGLEIDLEAGGGGRAHPVEVAEAPEVGEADEQHAEEKEHVDKGGGAELEQREVGAQVGELGVD